MSLVGNTVKISNVGLLSFFYPHYQVKSELFFDANNDIIYVGKPKPHLLRHLTLNTRSFINTVGLADIDLDNRDSMLHFVYHKHNKTPNDKTLEVVNNLSDDDYNRLIKKLWILGTHTLDNMGKLTMFDLFRALCVNSNSALTICSQLQEYYSINLILSSILTFLEKVVDIENVVVGGAYTRVLNKFNTKNRKNLKSILSRYYTLRGDSQYKLYWLVHTLGGY